LQRGEKEGKIKKMCGPRETSLWGGKGALGAEVEVGVTSIFLWGQTRGTYQR